jgi:hypothetical protein
VTLQPSIRDRSRCSVTRKCNTRDATIQRVEGRRWGRSPGGVAGSSLGRHVHQQARQSFTHSSRSP